MSSKNKNHGFTLVELIVTVTIIGILASIALPAYQSYIKKQKIRAAQADLIALSLNMENYFQQQLTYPAATTDTSSTKTRVGGGWSPGMDSDFAYKISASDTSSYTLVATGSSTIVSGCTVQIKSDNTRSLSGCGSSTAWY